MLADYHMHTKLCHHAQGEAAAYYARAVELGLPEMCFTDHVPSPDSYDSVNRMQLDQFPLYREMIAEVARTSRPESPAAPAGASKPTVLFGIEADYYEGCERFLNEWIPRQEFDLVLGSVHYINNWGFDNPEERHVWDSVDIRNTWQTYFKLIGRLADSRVADVIGHIDLPKKFGHRPTDRDLKEIAQPALDRIAAAGMAIEINTSGLRRPVHEIYPSTLLLSLARERNIPICFGSDAHSPNEVGIQFDAALALARSVGYTHAVQYRRRQPRPYALPKDAGTQG